MKNSYSPSLLPILCTTFFLFGVSSCSGLRKENGIKDMERTNVLFIVVDDMSPLAGCFGDPVAITPNIDRLAEGGLLFERAYCQAARCQPSRVSVMYGLRPNTSKIWDMGGGTIDTFLPDAISIPRHFRDNGYHTMMYGKVFHHTELKHEDSSFSEPPKISRQSFDEQYTNTYTQKAEKGKFLSMEVGTENSENYADQKVCRLATDALNRMKQSGKPFFLAVGFFKPHLPLCAPKKYWDLYTPESIPEPFPSQAPENAYPATLKSTGDGVFGYTDIKPLLKKGEKRIIPHDKMMNLRHGYYACISHTDAMIGRLLDQLDTLDLSKNTIVVLWADHSFHHGEYNLWNKGQNFEHTNRVPFIIVAPGTTRPDSRTRALVELVDIYPTLIEICNLPTSNQNSDLEGTSLVPLMVQPNRPWKKAVFNQFPKEGNMGYAIKTDRYRYIEWRKHVYDKRTKTFTQGKVLGRELYDHNDDPYETVNIAGKADQQERIKQLSLQLEAGWRAAVPILTEKKLLNK
ncbi:MAG: sulfatase [Bacteroidales bacterium]|nr:sulfatase [Bacteroidales bacterium]